MVAQTPQGAGMMVTQQQAQQPQQPQTYPPMNPSPVGAGVVPPTQAQPQPQPNQYQQQPQGIQQQQQGNFNYMQQQTTPQQQQQQSGNKQVQIWEGQIEWAEKDRNNPNIKVNNMASAVIYSFTAVDPNTGQLVCEVPVAVGQSWPTKIPLQMMSKQILDILAPWYTPPVRNLILYTDNQDVKNALTNVGVD